MGRDFAVKSFRVRALVARPLYGHIFTGKKVFRVRASV